MFVTLHNLIDIPCPINLKHINVNVPPNAVRHSQLNQSILKDEDFLIKFNQNTDQHLIAPDLEKFFINADYLLIEEGEIISVDYGGDALGISSTFRAYRNNAHHFFTHEPPFSDVTHNANFTESTDTGLKHHFTPVFFGNQASMSTQLIPHASEESTCSNNKKTYDTFHVLVQRKTKQIDPHSPTLARRFVNPTTVVSSQGMFAKTIAHARQLIDVANEMQKHYVNTPNKI